MIIIHEMKKIPLIHKTTIDLYRYNIDRKINTKKRVFVKSFNFVNVQKQNAI